MLNLCTSLRVQGTIPHPLSTEKEDLAPTPLLLVATSDAALRFFCFGHFEKQEVLTHAPAALPAGAPAWASAAAGAGAADGAGGGVQVEDVTDAAAATALPDSDEVGVGLAGTHAVGAD